MLNFKKTVCTVLALTLLLSSFFIQSANAKEAWYSGPYKFFVLDNNTAEIVNYTGSAKNLTVPDKLEYYTVTSIGNSAFSNCKIKSVNIPNTVTSIGSSAFSSCEKLESITIPNSVKNIGSDAFAFCKSLKSINIPENVEIIGGAAFAYCTSLNNINVSKDNYWYYSKNGNLYNHESELYQYAPGKKDKCIIVSDNISKDAFQGCLNLMGIYFVEDYPVTNINLEKLQGCKNLSTIYIPKRISAIEGNDSSYDYKLKEVYYEGSKKEWNNMYIDSYSIKNAKKYYNNKISFKEFKARTVKKSNTIKVTVKTKKIKANNLRKKKLTFKPFKISKAKGKVKFSKNYIVFKGEAGLIDMKEADPISDGYYSLSNPKHYSINSKTGALTIKKGKYKKGTFKIKIYIAAMGNIYYKPKRLTKNVTIKVR